MDAWQATSSCVGRWLLADAMSRPLRGLPMSTPRRSRGGCQGEYRDRGTVGLSPTCFNILQLDEEEGFNGAFQLVPGTP
ncbi:MAG: hypothetical protein ACRDYX_16875 [Egibacteraceae bacterium]